MIFIFQARSIMLCFFQLGCIAMLSICYGYIQYVFFLIVGEGVELVEIGTVPLDNATFSPVSHVTQRDIFPCKAVLDSECASLKT